MSLRQTDRQYHHRGSVLVTGPAVEPVTLPEVKAVLVIEDIADDMLLSDMIAEARAHLEHVSGMAFITQTWRLSLDQWPRGGLPWWDGVREGAWSDLAASVNALELPVWPLLSVASVTTYDDANTATVADIADAFDVDIYSRPGRLALRSGQVWPSATRPSNAVQIVYTAGYGATAAAVPPPIKRAIKQMVAYMYSHRGDGCDAGSAYLESGAAATMGIYKAVRI